MIIRTQGLVYEIPGIRRKTYLILFNGFLSNSPVLQITAGFRMLEELLVIKTCSRLGDGLTRESRKPSVRTTGTSKRRSEGPHFREAVKGLHIHLSGLKYFP